MSRRTKRIDYRTLHNSGKKVLLSSDSDSGDTESFHSDLSDNCVIPLEGNSESSQVELAFSSLFESISISDKEVPVSNPIGKMSTKEEVLVAVKDVSIAERTISADIDDYMDENPLLDAELNEIDGIVQKVEEFRTSYRMKHNELRHLSGEFYEAMFEENFQRKQDSIKNYILHAKHIKKQSKNINATAVESNRQSKKRSSDFLIKEINNSDISLEKELTKSKENVNDDEISRRKKDFPNLLKKMEGHSKMIKELLTLTIAGDIEMDQKVTQITVQYEDLCDLKERYTEFVDKEVQSRELNKQELFNESKLKIHLPKFNGYDSKLDYYSFKSDFQKLYGRTTPKRLLPDLLKNNYLDGSALLLVSSLDDIDDIWARLKAAYGDEKILLKSKLSEFDKINSLWKYRNPERLISSLSKLINVMKDVMKLAAEHDIEAKLYNGDGIDRIYVLLGDDKLTKWLSHISERNMTDKELWTELITFLEKDLNVQQKMLSIQNKSDEHKQINKDDKDRRYSVKRSSHYTDQTEENICHFCEGKDHVATNGPNGKRIVQYFACKSFVEMTPYDRYLALMEKGLCVQCLFPGAKQDKGRHQEGNCQRDFTCKHTSHERYQVKKHVLVCHSHRNSNENKQLLEVYKQRCINKQQNDLPSFSRDIKLSFLANSFKSSDVSTKFPKSKEDSTDENAIFMLQTINVDNKQYNLFYDSGCSEMVCRYDAVRQIGSRARHEVSGPLKLSGVGNFQSISQHGVYQVNLPLFNGTDAKLSGICLDEVTLKFPTYPLKGEVESDIKKVYKTVEGTKKLPDLPASVGGAETDFLIGIKYFRYYPKEIFSLPSGLTIFESWFKNPDGSRGVIGGPHKVFTEIEAHYPAKSFLATQYELFKNGYQVNPDVSLLHFKMDKDYLQDVVLDEESINCESNSNSYVTRRQKLFQSAEDAGSEILYRCSGCRSCKTCKEHKHLENVSLKEEVEQDLINRSIKVDAEKGITVASLPFIQNPSIKITSNKEIALRVYNQQIKKLNKSQKDKSDVIKSEAALQNLGYVEFVKKLSKEDQELLERSPIKYHIPWRAVWKENSVSTPCRIVYDASLSTSTGFSLNDVLAKGSNNMNKLLEIVIRWFSHHIAFHSDIRKMYNSIQLRKDDWTFQRYIWQSELDNKKIPVEKIIKTLIYGVRPSGNQAECGLRETARLSQDEYHDVYRIIHDDTYVDDCLSGGTSEEEAIKFADELEIVLNRGGFSLKGVTFSGSVVPENLSSDGASVSVAGMKWFPLEDSLSLDVRKLNFAKKQRGKKPTESDDVIPDTITRRHCVSKTAEIFDLTGKITPITATMKMDLHELVIRHVDWDDSIPDDLRSIWSSHFEMMREINSIKFNRAVIPEDAISLDLQTLDFGDASEKLCCVAIYARYMRKNGRYSSQLVFGRSKIIPTGMSQPRAELFAATVNTHTGEVVKRSFGRFHQGNVKVTDSQVVLYWIHNNNKPLKQWVRNRVIEIQRFTEPNNWKYTQTCNMIADIGTRRVQDLTMVNQNSIWINGYRWMKEDEKCFPFKSIEEIRLSNDEISKVKMESLSYDHWCDEISEVNDSNEEIYISMQQSSRNEMSHSNTDILNVPEEVRTCYQFSSYLLDPNKHRYRSVIRIMAIVLRFINKLKSSLEKKRILCYDEKELKCLTITDEEISNAENYYFKKATLEIKEFLKPRAYEKISVEKNDILHYTGRILPTDKVTIVGEMTEIMKDLSATTFCVPLIYKHSPLAYSIVNEIHWYSNIAKHSGIETIWRYVMKIAFIISGRDLVKKFKVNCMRCRYLRKKFIDIEMGPVSTYNLIVAPAFYASQVDLAGPFKAYDTHMKRKTIKVWFVVFCCATTATTNIKILEDYSTASFVLSFIRFACEVGYPRTLLIDEGSQLVKGCETMKLNFIDLQNKLHREMSVDFKVCPVGAHNVNGRVERRIRHIKESLEKTVQNERLSVIQWETVASQVANTINDLPLALGNIVADFENMDLLTPNRLRLGRNNERSPIFPMETTDYITIIENNKRIIQCWFNAWLVSHVPKLMEKPKWHKTERDMKICDVVLFLKQEGALSSTYQYGMVNEIQKDNDGVIRKVQVKYRNHNENHDRYTKRSVRQLVIIHPVDELSIMKELYDISSCYCFSSSLQSKDEIS